jgi:hypothetical protein
MYMLKILFLTFSIFKFRLFKDNIKELQLNGLSSTIKISRQLHYLNQYLF